MTDLSPIGTTNAQRFARDIVRELGINVSTEAETALVASLESSLAIENGRLVALDAEGRPRLVVRDGDVVELDPIEHMRDLARQHSKPATPAHTHGYEGMTAAGLAANAAKRSEDHKRQVAAEAAASGNPWSEQHWNVTRQHILLANDPDLASKLQQQA